MLGNQTLNHYIGVPNTVLGERTIALVIGVLHLRFLRINRELAIKNDKVVQPVEMAPS